MPRRLEANESPKELERFMVQEYVTDIVTVFEAGVLFLEMLSDATAKRGNYHTVGQDRIGSKLLVTSTIQDSKFYAGGARLADLLGELAEEYNWSDQMLQDALQAALRHAKEGKVSK